MIQHAHIRRGFAVLGFCGAAAGLALSASSSMARTEVTPYIEVQQVFTADLNGDGEVLTYTSASAGVNARASTQRLEAQISYQYERRISYGDDLADDDVHSGLAQASYKVVPGLVNFDAGAMAARSRADGSGPIFGFNSVDNSNVSEVYSLYAGPTLSGRVGALDVGAQYQIGYVKVDDHRSPTPTVGGRPVLDRYSSSVSHNASASVGMGPGQFPVGWTVGAGYVREDLDQLDQTYEGKYVRGDVVYPISHSLAVTAGVGYEKIQSKQDDIRRNADGTPIITPDGQLIADPSKPRLLAYDQSGLIWDAGVIWRPSRRTELQARVGQRYGGTTVTGSFRHDFGNSFGVRASVYDHVSSFGRQVIGDLNGLPSNFNTGSNPLASGVGGIGGCVFGRDPGSGTCFDNAYQTIGTSNFRSQGANLIFSGGRGPWTMGVGGGYSRRKYLAPATTGGQFTLDGVVDQSFSLSANASRTLGRDAGISLDGYASWFDSGIPGNGSAFSTGISGSYHRTLFIDRLQGYAALGLYTTDSGDFESTSAVGLIGARYTF
jgi:hypothetical protein